MRLHPLTLLTACASLLAACANQDVDKAVLNGSHLVCGAMSTPVGIQGYVAGVSSLASGTEVDLGVSLPIPSGGTCARVGDALFTSSFETPEITRYDMAADGSVTAAGVVNFASTGITAIDEDGMHFVDEELAYVVDLETELAVRWNPSTLEVTTVISLGGFADPEKPWLGFAPIFVRGDELVVGSSFATDEVFKPWMQLAFIGPDDEEPLYSPRDTRCGGQSTSSSAIYDDGTAYIGSNAFAAAQMRAGLDGAYPPCALRLRPDAYELDPDYHLIFEDVTGTALTAQMIRGAGNSAFVRIYNEEVGPLGDNPAPVDISRGTAWELFHLDDVRNPSRVTKIDELEPTFGSLTLSFNVEGRSYIGQVGPFWSSSTLVDVTDPDNVSEAINVPGIATLVQPLD